MRAAAAMCTLACGCSWLFQDQLRSPKDGGYDGRSQPQCDDGNGLAIVDFAIGTLAVIGIAAAVAGDEDEQKVVGGSAITAAIHVASGLTGMGWASECSAAYKDWRVKRVEIAADESERRTKEWDAKIAKSVPRQRKPPTPRGYFCASSPSDAKISTCAREKTDCERARSAVVVVAGDTSSCALTESAWCFDAGSGNPDEQCSATETTCEAQRAAMLASTPNAALSDCVEDR